jgi:hypothetical protein
MTTDTQTQTDKEALGQMLEQLHRFIRQRPGLEFGNYGDAASYRAEMRSITRDKRDAETMLFNVWRSQLTPADLTEAGERAFGGRLTWDGKGWQYVTGQYFPTEYRRAACAVLSTALWRYWAVSPFDTDAVRKNARLALGVGIAKRWFS